MCKPARGLLADDDRAGRGERLETRGDVSRVAERHRLLVHGTDEADRGGAGVDSDAHRELLDAPGLLDVACVVADDLQDP